MWYAVEYIIFFLSYSDSNLLVCKHYNDWHFHKVTYFTSQPPIPCKTQTNIKFASLQEH